MNEWEGHNRDLLVSLQERAKELNCIYEIEEIVRQDTKALSEIFMELVAVMPNGWFRPDQAGARIIHEGVYYDTVGFVDTEWKLKEDIVVQGQILGRVEVTYREALPALDEGPFLKEERRLIGAIAQRIGQTILHRNLIPVFKLRANNSFHVSTRKPMSGWRSVLEMLRITDQDLFHKMCRRMLNYLCYIGSDEAKTLLESIGQDQEQSGRHVFEHEGVNRPMKKKSLVQDFKLANQVLDIASKRLDDEIIYGHFEKWIRESKVSYFLDILEDQSASMADIMEAIGRFKESGIQEHELSPSTVVAAKVSIIRRFFSRRLDFINMAKKVISLDDAIEMARHVIFPIRSHGQLGGKSAGLFLAAMMAKNAVKQRPELGEIKVPKTWYLCSDAILSFIHYNQLQELMDHKYRDIQQIRTEYPNLIHLFKSCSFPADLVRGLSLALDDFGDRPLVVRSSSLLEDSVGAAFSGKHKSLFLANQGTKTERMDALTDAIAEVYASMFGPDPIEYRAERGLLDFREEMGILIQEVVGEKVGPYILPAFAGVAFTRNEFRWSPRIRREDGLLRLVPGLGTRAVDRVSDDYPILVAPGQPGLRVNSTIEEILRYAPKYVDLINVETNSIETVEIAVLLREYGAQYPRLKQLFSKVVNGMIRPVGLADFESDCFVATFNGLISNSDFVPRMKLLMDILATEYGMPVDVEFAADATDLFLLQCRPQSSAKERVVVAMPENVIPEDILFTASRYVSDGLVTDITHVVYVDPEAYAQLEKLTVLQRVGRVVGRLNTILPKRQFVLIGPGRWGSRGDIKLGVNVTYSEINNTSALIEVAQKKGNYVPDLSFGTHFFQDLVEASIFYLPLYPDEDGNVFNRDFFHSGENILEHLIPEARDLMDVIKVIDVSVQTQGKVMKLLMNGDEGRAMAMLYHATCDLPMNVETYKDSPQLKSRDEYWLWRHRMAERLASSLKPGQFGVKGIYLFGSTKNATAGPCSDIDLLFHVDDGMVRKDLIAWLDGWSRCLGEINTMRTGSRTDSLLDIHFVNDQDIARGDSYALKISAVSDPARPLPMQGQH